MQALARGIGRYLLRFTCFYWICFTFPFPLSLVGLPFQLVESNDQPTWMKSAGEKYTELNSWLTRQRNDACTRVGHRILHVEVIVQPTGSGDTVLNYVSCFCGVVIAAVAAGLWSAVVLLVSRWRPAARLDDYLHGLVRVLVRFFLCGMLFSYGFHKVFPLQFPEPGSSRLAQQVGEMSPMRLLWTFMGFSTPYQSFTGAVEVLAGLLLTMRRTTPLGAIVTLVAMTHIFALNMCFDVPVKLHSFTYLIMAVFLLAPELPRLIRVLVLGKAVEARPFTPSLGNVTFDRLALVFRTLLVAAMLYSQIHSSYKSWSEMHGGPPAPVLGRWDVVSIEVDKKELDKDDPMKWSWLDFSNKKIMRLAGAKPPNLVFFLTWDLDQKKLALSKALDPAWSASFTYELPEPDKLELRGSVDGKAISATLKHAPEKSYELLNRGFHWIQELPYNR